MFDIIIKGGRIISGAGNPWYRGDIGIDEGRIIEVDDLGNEKADTIINADSKIVCPGFIDIHSHSDLAWLAKPKCEAKVMQGVTTEVIGQDGLSVAPVRGEHISLLKGLTSGLLGEPDIEWEWTSIGEYLLKFKEHGMSVNIAMLAPHGNIRIWAMGMEKRDPTTRELSEMKELLEKSFDEGAFGLSTGLIYPPCSYSTKKELVELCKIVSNHRGYLAVHMRDEGRHVLDSIREVIRVGGESGVSIHISHCKAAGKSNWGKVSMMLELVNNARKKGLELTFEQYPYTAGSTTLWILLPPWILENGFKEALEQLKDEHIRYKLKDDIKKGITGWENPSEEAGWENIFISSLKCKKNKNLIGKSIREIARTLDKEPVDAVIDLLLDEKGTPSIILFLMSEINVCTIMKHPLQMFCTDGLIQPGKPHPRSYGTYPRVLGHYVREKRVLNLEEAIRKMTSYPAQRLRLEDRGIVKIGAYADLVVFDQKKIHDKATYKNPIRFSEGIEYVIVNGQITVKNRHHTNRINGKILTFKQK